MAQIKRYPEETVTTIECVLQKNPANVTGIVLRLAWFEGLTRDEITELTWDQIDFDEKMLRLTERDVPFEGDTEACLCKWKTICEESSEFVIVSTNRRKPIEPQSISRIVRTELNREGLKTVSLRDLRNQFILRQAEMHGWEYAVRVAGISVTTYRYFYGAGNKCAALKAEPAPIKGLEQKKIEAILAGNKKSPEGIALWLSWRCGLTGLEIVDLVWGQIDFDRKIVYSGGKRRNLSDEVIAVLKDEMARRSEGDDPHVVLSPRSKKPLKIDRLSVITRSLLIRGGLDNAQIGMLQKERNRLSETEELNQYLAEHGSISRKEYCDVFGVSPDVAYRRLSSSEAKGIITRINRRYYPAEQTVKPDDYKDAIIRYLAEHETATKQDIKDLLHIGMRPVYHLLTRMVKEGKLTKTRKDEFYRLSESTAKSIQTEGGESDGC